MRFGVAVRPMNRPGMAREMRASMLGGLGEGVHSRSQRLSAFAICVAFGFISLVALRFGSVQGPEIKPFLPIVATMWGLADAMTAFLLLAQFYVNGTRFFTVVAAAYGFNGLLTWPYLLAFPGIFNSGSIAAPDQQISIWLWTIWHAVFPAMIALSAFVDPGLKLRSVSRVATRNALCATIVAVVVVSAGITTLVYELRAALPVFVVNGRLYPPFTHIAVPVVVLLNVAACIVILRRGRNLTTLHLWLLVAMFAAILDGLLLAMSPSRYSYGWYVGKIESVTTASVVLGVLLSEVTGLYRRLAEMAILDPLTQLFNRRAFEEHVRLILGHAQRKSSPLALLVIDVDFFKGYNDANGHAEGDECLRKIAGVLARSATRPLDHVARYGGEEFVVLLPDTPREGAVAVAKLVLRSVAAANIRYPAYALGHVTVSVGLGTVADARYADGGELFEAADGALYEAKASGRNRYVTKEYVPAAPKVVPLRREERA